MVVGLLLVLYLVQKYRYLLFKRHLLRGQTVLITGGVGSLGKQICLRLAKEQVGTLVIWDWDHQALESFSAELKNDFPQLHVITNTVNLEDFERLRSLLKETTESCVLSIDIIINCAAICHGGADFRDTSHVKHTSLLNINYMAPLIICGEFIPYFEAKGRGHIVNVASSICYTGAAGLATYAASKAALRSFTESMWNELWIRGSPVTCSLVNPGYFESPLFAGFHVPGLSALSPSYVASDVVERALLRRQQVVQSAPRLCFLPFLTGILHALGFYAFIPHNSMKGWKGESHVASKAGW